MVRWGLLKNYSGDAPSMSFQITLDVFRGPLDLLLYLVRKHELDILDIPISTITEQFLGYLEILEQLDVNMVGDFLEMASTLIEIKSRMVLPQSDEEEGEIEDPRENLVEKLLEYKKYKDAASLLDERSRQWQQRFSRQSNDLPPRQRNLAQESIAEVELWDLVSAFGRVLRDQNRTQPTSIVYDDTPIEMHMQHIHKRLLTNREVALSDLLQAGMHKSTLIGIFLAILELVRHHQVCAEQGELHGEIKIKPGDTFNHSLKLKDVDNYGSSKSELENSETQP